MKKIADAGIIKVNFHSSDFSITLTKETEITLYRIVQEVINNMVKHAQTPEIDIKLSHEKGQVSLLIKDYGKGFDTNEISESKGIGWQNIYSRVSMLNGEIYVNSSINEGTIVLIKFMV